MQLNFLLWNTGRRSLPIEISELAQKCDAHIIVLCEHTGDGLDVQRALININSDYELVPAIACDRIRLYTTFPQSTIDHGPETDRHTIKQLSLPGLPPLILGLAHLPSKLHSDDFDQLHNAMYFRSSIEEGEESFRHQNTIVMGDFNMNPFDPGMISAGGLNAVPCAEIAKKINRTVNGKVHDFFYNPTWNLLGDFNQPTGSYYHASPSHLSHYWNMLDQVVLRPSIASMLIKNSLQLITNTGTTPLIDSKGRPLVSDHLPLSFSLNYN